METLGVIHLFLEDFGANTCYGPNPSVHEKSHWFWNDVVCKAWTNVDCEPRMGRAIHTIAKQV